MRKIYFTVLLICLLCFITVPAYANTLSVILEKDSDVKIDGASVEIYKIADVQIGDNKALYTLLPEYRSKLNDIRFDTMTVSESMELAAQMVDIVKNPVSKSTTDMEGSFIVEIPDDGMYLVVQTERNGTAEKYKMFSPFLVSVPLFNEETEGWEYDVVTRPKTTIVPEPVFTPTPEEPTPTPEEPTPTPEEPTPTPEEPTPTPEEPTPTPEEPTPTAGPTPTPEEPTPTPEEPTPTTGPTPTPEEPTPTPEEPTPTPEEPTPTPEKPTPTPEKPTPTPEEPTPTPGAPTPTPEEPTPTAGPTPTPEKSKPTEETTPTPAKSKPTPTEKSTPTPEPPMSSKPKTSSGTPIPTNNEPPTTTGRNTETYQEQPQTTTTPTNETQSGKLTSVGTGEESHIMLYLGLIFAVMMLFATIFERRQDR